MWTHVCVIHGMCAEARGQLVGGGVLFFHYEAPGIKLRPHSNTHMCTHIREVKM